MYFPVTLIYGPPGRTLKEKAKGRSAESEISALSESFVREGGTVSFPDFLPPVMIFAVSALAFLPERREGGRSRAFIPRAERPAASPAPFFSPPGEDSDKGFPVFFKGLCAPPADKGERGVFDRALIESAPPLFGGNPGFEVFLDGAPSLFEVFPLRSFSGVV